MRTNDDDDENNWRQHRRLNDSENAVTFQELNNDCLIMILSFLSSNDLNSFAECNHRCRQARNNESLDQTRTGTVIWSGNYAAFFLRYTISSQGVDGTECFEEIERN